MLPGCTSLNYRKNRLPYSIHLTVHCSPYTTAAILATITHNTCLEAYIRCMVPYNECPYTEDSVSLYTHDSETNKDVNKPTVLYDTQVAIVPI